jgi:hypothetical protein
MVKLPSVRRRTAACLLGFASAAGPSLVRADEQPEESSVPMALAVRAGSGGVGLDYDIGLGRHFSARVGYSALSYDHNVSTSDADYAGTLKLSMVDGLLDWYVFGGGFHLTAGAVGGGTHLDVTGVPSGGGYTLNGHYYPVAEVGSLSGQLKFGSSVSPYVGLGWGRAVGAGQHLHLLVDIGAIHGGTPRVTLNALCGPAAPAGGAACNALQADAEEERQSLASDVRLIQWYPILDLGLAYRF